MTGNAHLRVKKCLMYTIKILFALFEEGEKIKFTVKDLV